MGAPKTSDGKPIFLPNLFPGDVVLYYAGAGDSSTKRGDGPLFVLSQTDTGDATLEFSFMDWIYVAGGTAKSRNALAGDWIDLKLYCPATPVVPNAQSQGNCNLVDPGVGAAILIVPSPGAGAYDVNLAAANLVPASQDTAKALGSSSGTALDTGKGTITAGIPGEAQFHLIAVNVDLARFAKLPLIDDVQWALDLGAIKPKKILPHWKFKTTLHNESGQHTVEAAFVLTTARKKTL